MKKFHSCVTPEGKFIYGIHKPEFTVENFRTKTNVSQLGILDDKEQYINQANYPDGEVHVSGADWIFEIRNPFTFRGVTYIDKEWADNSAANPARIRIPVRKGFSLSSLLDQNRIDKELISKLPEELLLTVAISSNDPDDLIALAHIACSILLDDNDNPTGLAYKSVGENNVRSVIHNHLLFEAVANNINLPDSYKRVMVLQPGAQGKSEIVGEYETANQTHLYEYMRRNSYIGGGHYAANMAEDAVRYSIKNLTMEDMTGLRHLYYQRTYTRFAKLLDINSSHTQEQLQQNVLEDMRQQLLVSLKTTTPEFTATLWGWNYGFDYAPTRYRLHASHQQIHQQYAMLPEQVDSFSGDPTVPIDSIPSYGCGDMIAKVMQEYKDIHNGDFFTDYRKAIFSNERMDGDSSGESSLIIWQDKNVIVFVPKAQTSQWEVQIMTVPDSTGNLVGNILEADQNCRNSLDKAIFIAQKALYGLGAEMVTSIEYPKRIHHKEQLQPLIYCLLPRLPESPGAFSEAQLRYINGHYPEDFAAECRKSLDRQNLI